MPKTIEIKESTFGGEVLSKISIELKQEAHTLKDLIKFKVDHAVEEYNKKSEQRFFVFIPEGEKNNKKKKIVDKESAFYKALESFKQNAFFVLVDGNQVDSIDDELMLHNEVDVRFIKLTPLVGG